MGAIVDVDTDRITAVPQSKIRLNILVEHPRVKWDTIKVSTRYSALLGIGAREYPAINRPNEIGISVINDEVTIPPHQGEDRLGEITVDFDGEIKDQYLPRIRVLTLDGYFEEKVAETMRVLGFDAVRLGGPRRPDIEAVHRKQQEQRFQIEATLQDHYDLDNLRRDKGKFHELKKHRNYRRLLIVTNTDRIAGGVIRQLRRETSPISMITFRELCTLSSRYEKTLMSSYAVIAALSQTGIIKVPHAERQSVNDFRLEAYADKTIKVSVRFEATAPIPQEEASIIAQVKSTSVERVMSVAGMKKVGEMGRVLELIRGAKEAPDKSGILRKVALGLPKITGERAEDSASLIYIRDMLRLLEKLDLIDHEYFTTLEGDKVLRYFEGDREKFLDIVAYLLLSRGGWIAVIRELDALRKGMFYAASHDLFSEWLTDSLRREGLVKRTDSWTMPSLMDCLVELQLIRPWDPVQKTYEIEWDRLYDVMARKTFT